MNAAPSSYRPAGALVASPLAPYAGPWNARLAAHLARRAGFGGSPADVRALATRSMRAAVDGYVRFASTDALAAVPAGLPDETDVDRELVARAMSDRRTALESGVAPDPMTSPPGSMRATLAADPGLVTLRKERRRLEREAMIDTQRWWLDRMIATPAPLQEKMTLFWHGHFTTAAIAKGVTPAEALAQNRLFRTYALGNVRELTQKVSLDPAMLRYLDTLHNERAHPNENYARELMELFTLGIGNYSETDVREAARAWTGIRVRRATGEVFRNAALFDDGPKTVLGKTGNLDGPDVVDLIFAQPACASFFATKLLEFFVYTDPEPELVATVAEALRRANFELAPVLGALFSSRVFYSDRAYRALVKSPVEFVVGSYRLFGVTTTDLAAQGALRRMNQILFYPPNVKGWPGGASWINTSTVLARENFTNALMTAKTVSAASSWLLASGPGDPGDAANALVTNILQGDASPAAVASLQRFLRGDESAANGALSIENFDQRMRGGAYLTMAMPAYQLA